MASCSRLRRDCASWACSRSLNRTWSVSDLVRMSGYPRATTYRLVRTLESERYLVLNPATGRYQIGLAATALLHSLTEPSNLRLSSPSLCSGFGGPTWRARFARDRCARRSVGDRLRVDRFQSVHVVDRPGKGGRRRYDHSPGQAVSRLQGAGTMEGGPGAASSAADSPYDRRSRCPHGATRAGAD